MRDLSNASPANFLALFIIDHGITLSSVKIDKNPSNDEFQGNHYEVTLQRASQRRMTTYFSKGYGHEGKSPEVFEVLNCLQSDCWLVRNNETFDDFCRELGYDTDSRRAEKIYEACKKTERDLDRFMGNEMQSFLEADVTPADLINQEFHFEVNKVKTTFVKVQAPDKEAAKELLQKLYDCGEINFHQFPRKGYLECHCPGGQWEKIRDLEH